MANVKRFMLTLLLGALVWMVPSAAQVAPNLLVETVRVRIKDAKPGGDYVVNTMDAFGNRKPVTYVIECFPVGSDRSVSWLRVDQTSLNGILAYKDFPEPNFRTHNDLKRIENGWELTLWTIPGKEGTAATELKVWSTKDGHGGTEKEVATKTLRVTTKDVPVHGIKLKVEAQEPVPVGKGGTIRVVYNPENATDRRVRITSDDGVVEVLPTNVPGIFSFKVLKNGSAHLHAVAEDGRVGAPTAEETFTVVQHHISDVKMAMSDGDPGGAGYDKLIYRNQTKDWMLHVTVTSDGPIVGLEKELAWEGKIGNSHIANGLYAPIYGKGAPHNGNKVWQPALVGRSSEARPDGTVVTQLEYAFKADEKVDAPYLSLALSWTDGNGATKTANYTLRIGEVKVSSFGVDPKETDLYVGSKPNGFITVTPAPSLAYYQGFSVRRKPGTGSDRVLKAEPIESPTGSGRYVFEAKEAGTATLTIAAADGGYTQDVTVNVRKVGVTAFALRNETESKNITGGDYVLRLKKGERVQLRLDVTSEQAYDRGFDIVGASTAGNSRTLTVGDAGTLTIEALEGAWGQPGLYEVTGAVPGNAPAAFTLKSNADREGGAAGEKLTFSFKYVVTPNPVRGITLDRQSLEFVYDAEAPKSIRGGVDAQAVRIDVTPETAADATFKFTDIPGWLEVQDANGKRVNRDTKGHPAGDYYVKVTDPRNAGKNLQTQTAEIKVVSDSQSGVTATLRVELKYIPVTGFVVEGKTELMVDRAERFTVRVVPKDASNPRFKLVVKTNDGTIAPINDVAVSQGGEQINVTNFGNIEKKKEGVPGEITVVGTKVSQQGKGFTLGLKAAELKGGGLEYVSAVFSVGIEPVQSVSYAPELVVPIRSSAFKHPYTVLPVTVTPANASRPALEFKQKDHITWDPRHVTVDGPQGEGSYLFERKNKNDYTDREEVLVGVVKDNKNMKGGALKVKVVNVKPTKITVVDLEGNEITKPIELAKGVSYSYPLRVLVEPDSVSLAELKWSPIPGKRFPGTWRVKQVGAERDTVKHRLILNYLVQTQDFATGESGFEISHTYGDGSAATKKQILFDQPKNVIEKITVDPAEVVFAGESATAIVTVTYSPEVVDNDVLGHTMRRIVPKGLLPTIVVTQVEKLGNVYKYEIKYNASVFAETTEVTFKATVGGASGTCTVVALPSGATTNFTLSSADPKMKDGVLELTLGEEGMDVAEANLFREPSTQDAFYRLVEWELWRGGTKLELSKYLEVERKAFNGVGVGSTWELQLRGLNKTAEGLDDAPLTLRAVMGTGVNRRTSDIQVRVRRSAKANERPIESVEFPIERLVVGLGETRTVEMEVAPADPSLKRLQWDFSRVPGKIEGSVSVVEGSGDEWRSLRITGTSIGFTRMRVRASDMFGRQTSRMLLIEVVQSHYPIVVDVVDGEGRPLADARVQIRENGNNQPWLFSAYTGDEGRVEYDAVSKKTYVAEVSRSGYVRNRNNPATIYVGNKLVQVRWVLDRDLTKPVLYGVRFEVKGDGKALPGAVVSFAGFGDAESDAQGVAVYRDVPAGRYYATVRAEGYRPATVAVKHGMLEATTVQVSLEKEPMVTQKHSLTVVVRNKETQGLVEDAVVTVDGRAGVTTDVNGVATVANLEDGEYAIMVEGSGEPWKEENGKKYYYKPQKVQVRVAGGNARLEVALESVVANEQPKPTMRTLTVVTVDGEFGVMLDGVDVRVAGGDVQKTVEGKAEFKLADSRSKRKVTASKRGYVSQEEQVLVNGADATVRFTMAVQTYSVALTVKGEGGAVLKDAVVYLDGSREAKTDGAGVARFDNVRVGGHTLLAVAEGYVNGELGVDVSSDFAGEITLERGFSPKPMKHTLTVTVKSGNNPLPGATVRLASGKTAETDANGMATFEVLNGTYVVEAFKTGYKRGEGTVEVKDNNANLNIAMEEDFSPYVQSSVTVSVTDKVSGKALDNAKVVITGATPAKQSGNVWEYKLVKGTYTLVVSCEGYVTQVETLTVTNANITKEIELVRGKNPKFD
ncbi:MAG: carboxypeptidase regulatory-like domain-containing protein, partial [Bacteroidia bacterium]|nr:carboxypeptidase regulatory-like domain-containing protein [Bacteroidia bacterium]